MKIPTKIGPLMLKLTVDVDDISIALENSNVKLDRIYEHLVLKYLLFPSIPSCTKLDLRPECAAKECVCLRSGVLENNLKWRK